MSSIRQIEANRRNAQLSTGPVSEEGKKKSRRNALRHGLTAETVIHGIEDADDYASFEMAVTADYDPRSAVERELVLRLASLLWRLRRATAIEAGLFSAQAQNWLGTISAIRRNQRTTIDRILRNGADKRDPEQPLSCEAQASIDDAPSSFFATEPLDDLTKAFVGLADLPTCPLDRLNRYEAALWRQTYQILFTLRFLERRKPWDRPGRRADRGP